MHKNALIANCCPTCEKTHTTTTATANTTTTTTTVIFIGPLQDA